MLMIGSLDSTGFSGLNTERAITQLDRVGQVRLAGGVDEPNYNNRPWLSSYS